MGDADEVVRRAGAGGAGGPAPVPADAHLAAMVRRCATGDVDAFTRFYDATSGVVYRVSMMVLKDAARAESTTRRTFDSVWSRSSRYDPSRDGTVLSWVTTLAYQDARVVAGRQRS